MKIDRRWGAIPLTVRVLSRWQITACGIERDPVEIDRDTGVELLWCLKILSLIKSEFRTGELLLWARVREQPS